MSIVLPTAAQIRLMDGEFVPQLPYELECRIRMLNYKYRKILDRAAELGAERYKIAADAVAKPNEWNRLAAIDRERATLELELQHVHAAMVEARNLTA